MLPRAKGFKEIYRTYPRNRVTDSPFLDQGSHLISACFRASICKPSDLLCIRHRSILDRGRLDCITVPAIGLASFTITPASCARAVDSLVSPYHIPLQSTFKDLQLPATGVDTFKMDKGVTTTEENSVSENGYSGPSRPVNRSFGQKLKAHFKKWWWLHLIIFCAIVLIVVLCM